VQSEFDLIHILGGFVLGRRRVSLLYLCLLTRPVLRLSLWLIMCDCRCGTCALPNDYRANTENNQHGDSRQASHCKRPVTNTGALGVRGESRSQTKIEVRGSVDGTQTADDLPELRLLPLKLAAISTSSHVLGGSPAELLVQRQLLKLPANHLTLFISHNYLTYK
jgi:hypothetical protein